MKREIKEVSPVLNPPHKFSEGEDVLVTVEGMEVEGKVIEVIKGERGHTYKVTLPSLVVLKETDLQKV